MHYNNLCSMGRGKYKIYNRTTTTQKIQKFEFEFPVQFESKWELPSANL